MSPWSPTPTPARPAAASSAGEPEAGTRLGDNYCVERVLGRGSMGVVFLARDLSLQRRVAIKMLAKKYAADEAVAARFRREAVAMASVRHENVVQIFAFGDHHGRPYFVMEYVPGHTVAALIENANRRGEYIYFDVALGILTQVCRGLQAVHDAGIVHRDVKPANMLVGPGFRVALTDFGLVEIAHDSADQRDLAGTPLYIAPELIQRKASNEAQRFTSDIYALGVSAHEMLTGQPPFSGRTVKEILRQHLNQAPPPVSEQRADLPTAVDAVISKCLAKSPAQRYPGCSAFIAALSGSRRKSDPESAPRSGSRTIVVAEGHAVTRQIYSTALKVGFPDAVILTPSDGIAALEMAKAQRIDLIFVDLALDQLNGLELCATLRGDELTAEIPLVVISDRSDAGTRSVLRSLGIGDTLLKPVEATHLVHLARRCLKQRNRAPS